MKHTLGTAAKATGVSKSTIYRAVKSGKLSASRNTDDEYEIDPAELHRVYPPVSERAATDDMEHSATPEETGSDSMLVFLREQIITAQAKADAFEHDLEQTRDELKDTSQRLNEHREAARSLMSPEQFSEQVEAAVNAEREKAEAKSREWERVLAERSTEMEAARKDAVELKERLQGEASERSKAETAVNAERQESERRSAEWKQSLAERQAEIADARKEAAELSDRLQHEADKVQHEANERAKAERLAKALKSRGLIDRLLNREPDVLV
jgi:excisionase family DNA binding protein